MAGKKSVDDGLNVSEVIEEPKVKETPVNTSRRVHCEACSQNYMLEIGKTPVCCEKPTIKDL